MIILDKQEDIMTFISYERKLKTFLFPLLYFCLSFFIASPIYVLVQNSITTSVERIKSVHIQNSHQVFLLLLFIY